jgi:hypothetical protein
MLRCDLLTRAAICEPALACVSRRPRFVAPPRLLKALTASAASPVTAASRRGALGAAAGRREERANSAKSRQVQLGTERTMMIAKKRRVLE